MVLLGEKLSNIVKGVKGLWIDEVKIKAEMWYWEDIALDILLWNFVKNLVKKNVYQLFTKGLLFHSILETPFPIDVRKLLPSQGLSIFAQLAWSYKT